LYPLISTVTQSFQATIFEVGLKFEELQEATDLKFCFLDLQGAKSVAKIGFLSC
jgi:hypothetical protein